MAAVQETLDLDVPDEGVRQLLRELLSRSAGPVGLPALIEAIVHQNDPAVSDLLLAALPPDFTPENLFSRDARAAIPVILPIAGNSRRPGNGKAELSPAAAAAVHDYKGMAQSGVHDGLDLLLACAATRLGPAELQLCHPLNVDALLRRFSSRRAAGVPRPSSSAPGQARGWTHDDLTARVRDAGPSGGSPFDRDPAYIAFFELLARALHRTTPRHVVLLREPGIAEHAVLVEFAQRALRGEPPFLRERRIVRVDCRHVPPMQLPALVEGLFGVFAADAGAVLCLDSFATLLRGRDSGGNRAAVMAALASVECRAVAILSPQEFEEHLSHDGGAHELFSVLTLNEPELPAAFELTRHFANGLQEQHRVRVDDEAVRRAVVLTSSYVLHERLPLKAVKVLRSVCEDLEFDRSQLGAAGERVTENHVVTKVAAMTGIPAATLAGVGEQVDYYDTLRDVIVGQDHAVREVATELSLIKAGLVDPGKPASVMMFIGQTGTGKTEMAKALARVYSSSKRLKTFTLGNFSEPHSVSGLIGVPAGYVGHDQGGRLINELNADPYSVFLLDEADKAHPDVMQPFLNLFDEGWIYDQRGVKAFADRAIFVLTTNVAQRQIGDMCKEGKSPEEIIWAMKESLARIRHTKSNRPVFTPEFLARIKRVIVFRSLDAHAMSAICRRLGEAMAREWQLKRQKTLLISDSLLDAIAAQACALNDKSHGREGGRIVRKLLADLIESRVQAAIAADVDGYRASRGVEVDYYPPTPLGEDGDAAPGSSTSPPPPASSLSEIGAVVADGVRVHFEIPQRQ